MDLGYLFIGLICLATPIVLLLVALANANRALATARESQRELGLLRAEVAGLREAMAGLRHLPGGTQAGGAADRPGAMGAHPAGGPPPEAPGLDQATTPTPRVPAVLPSEAPAASIPAAGASLNLTEPAASMSLAPPAAGALGSAPPSAAATLPGAAALPGGPPSAAEPPPRASGFGNRGDAELGDGRDWEATLGGRLPVWLGAIALALAGTFLVKYAFDHDLLGPTVRVALGILFGVLLLAAGELGRGRTPRIPEALSAAGVAVLYASFLSAGRLYGLISIALAFALMALTTAVAIGLSLRQGRLVAVVGLAGGFLTPYLLGPSEDPNPTGLFAYLLMVQAGLLVVARRRGWGEIAIAALAASFVWTLAWREGPMQAGDNVPLGLFLLASALIAAAAALLPRLGPAWGDAREPQALIWIAFGGGMVAMVSLGSWAGFTPLDWAYLALLGLGSLVLGRLDATYDRLPWMAAALCAVALLDWKYLDLGTAVSEGGPPFLATTAVFGLLFAGGAYAALWGAPRPERWAALAAASGALFFLVAYGGIWWHPDKGGYWGGLAILLAALYILAAYPVARRRQALLAEEAPPDELYPTTAALGALAAAATLFVALAVPLQLADEWLAVAWAIQVAALVWLAGSLDLPVLRRLAWPVAALVALRLLYEPGIPARLEDAWPFLNWLLYGYGIPIAAFALAAYIAALDGDRRLAEVLGTLAITFGVWWIGLSIHHYFHLAGTAADAAPFGGPLAAYERVYWNAHISFTEWALLASAWLAYGLGLLLAARRWPARVLRLGGQALLLLGAATAFYGPVLVANPLLAHESVGATPIANRLLLAFGLPALLMLLAARQLDRLLEGEQRRLWVRGLALAAFLLVFVGWTLQVRQIFHGPYLNEGPVGLAEQYAYSLAWVILGVILLVIGVSTGSRTARYASLAVMALAVFKVFLYDLSNLQDLYRVFSFLGLGVSLLLLGYVYQRFVFREEPT